MEVISISELMRPKDVAEAFGVDTRSLTRWANDGRLRFVVTLGGHRRYYKADVLRLLEEGKGTAA